MLVKRFRWRSRKSIGAALTYDELAARAGKALSEKDLSALEAVGLVRRRGGSYLLVGNAPVVGALLSTRGFTHSVAVAAAAETEAVVAAMYSESAAIHRDLSDRIAMLERRIAALGGSAGGPSTT